MRLIIDILLTIGTLSILVSLFGVGMRQLLSLRRATHDHSTVGYLFSGEWALSLWRWIFHRKGKSGPGIPTAG